MRVCFDHAGRILWGSCNSMLLGSPRSGCSARSRMAKEPENEKAAELYRELRGLLAFLAARRFGVPPDEAEELVHDVFAAYLRRQPAVHDLRAWFVGAICHASRHYWRKQARFVHLEHADMR